MGDRRVELRLLSEENLTELLDAAVSDAGPDEVMPPVPGPPGWTEGRRRAFCDFHRSRSIGTGEPVETTYVITLDDRVIGAARLEPSGDSVVMGVWIGRSRRGRGIGRLVTADLLALARRTGAGTITASTTPGNAAAQQLLRGIGATLTITDDAVDAVMDAPH
ncbi:MAG: GNAT family N-acetyltransferase [Pseudonocardiaceae bacterium]